MAPVDIEDSGAFLLRTVYGINGVLELSWIHPRPPELLHAEISGTEGAIIFDYERLNELHVARRGEADGGFTRVIVGPAQDGELVSTLGGLGVGFAETIIVHYREPMESVYGGTQASPVSPMVCEPKRSSTRPWSPPRPGDGRRWSRSNEKGKRRGALINRAAAENGQSRRPRSARSYLHRYVGGDRYEVSDKIIDRKLHYIYCLMQSLW